MVVTGADSIDRSFCARPISLPWRPKGQTSVLGSTAAGVSRTYPGFVRRRRVPQDLRPTHPSFDPCTCSQPSSCPDNAGSLRILAGGLPETETGIAAKVPET